MHGHSPARQTTATALSWAEQDVCPSAQMRWWEGCRFIGLTSIGLWIALWQVAAYIF